MLAGLDPLCAVVLSVLVNVLWYAMSETLLSHRSCGSLSWLTSSISCTLYNYDRVC